MTILEVEGSESGVTEIRMVAAATGAIMGSEQLVGQCGRHWTKEPGEVAPGKLKKKQEK